MLADRALDHVNVDVTVVQEVKILEPKFILKKGFGYSILATAAGTDNCGRVELLMRENDLCMVKEAKQWDPNVISWEMQVGKEKEERWYYGMLPLPVQQGWCGTAPYSARHAGAAIGDKAARPRRPQCQPGRS